MTRPFYISLLYKGKFDPLVLASGVDARLYEAEAKLAANDIPGMMTILNALRTASPRPVIGLTTIPAMATLKTPANQGRRHHAAVPREGVLDVRSRPAFAGSPSACSPVRTHRRTRSSRRVSYFKGGDYGTDENFPVPSSEQVNPLFTSCLDRKA